MYLFCSIMDRKNQFCVSGGREEIAGAGLLASGNQPSHPDEKIKKICYLKK